MTSKDANLCPACREGSPGCAPTRSGRPYADADLTLAWDDD